jgi:hypothetical protein
MSATHSSQSDELGSGHVFPLLYNLVYCSRATSLMDDTEVTRILDSARRRNPAQGITGLLVFGSGIFFQWLEGPRDNVTQLMDLLKADPRHDSIVELTADEEVRERLFPDWDMEFVAAEDIRDVLLDALDETPDGKSAEALRSMLEELDSGPIEQSRRSLIGGFLAFVVPLLLEHPARAEFTRQPRHPPVRPEPCAGHPPPDSPARRGGAQGSPDRCSRSIPARRHLPRPAPSAADRCRPPARTA